MHPELRERFSTLLGERMRFATPLARYTSFRIGGPAEALAVFDSVLELQAFLRMFHEKGVPYFLLGGGTNVLVSDNGVRGVVIRLGEGFSLQQWEETGNEALVRVGAARPLGRFVRDAVAKGYGGVEFAEGIPGSVGGGLLMNAGAFGGELSRIVKVVSGVQPNGEALRVPGDAVGFSRTDPAADLPCRAELRCRRTGCADRGHGGEGRGGGHRSPAGERGHDLHRRHRLPQGI